MSIGWFEREARENIERGMGLLTEVEDRWLWLVAPDFLDVSSGGHCPLGQLFGTYALGLDRLWPDLDEDARDRAAHAHGFCVGAHLGLESTRDFPYWDTLTRLWREMIEDRRFEQTGVRVGGDRS